MLLNLGIIKYRLSVAPEFVCGDIYHELTLHEVRLLPSSASREYSPGQLYVMSWNQHSEAACYPSHLVCIGGGSEAEEFFSERSVFLCKSIS